jgi:hypothetical protein
MSDTDALASISAQLEALRQGMTQRNDTTLLYLRQDMELRFAKVDAALERLSAAMEARATTCPHRETIIRAANHVAEIRQIKEDIEEIKLQLARNPMIGGAAAGGLVSLMTMLMFGIGKLAGWW